MSCIITYSIRNFITECSGVHRSLGVHYSKVRSLNLDMWELEIIKVMTELGNKVINSVYECKVPEEVPRAQPKCDRYYMSIVT